MQVVRKSILCPFIRKTAIPTYLNMTNATFSLDDFTNVFIFVSNFKTCLQINF